jgi:hypothetical protein
LPSQEIKTAVDWISEKSIDVKNQNGGSVVSVTIPAGGVSIVELKTQSAQTKH